MAPNFALHKRKVVPTHKTDNRTQEERMFTMAEAIEYLARYNIPCQSRVSFYRLIDNFKIPYTDTNPCGKYRVRRFAESSLKEFLHSQGLL